MKVFKKILLNKGNLKLLISGCLLVILGTTQDYAQKKVPNSGEIESNNATKSSSVKQKSLETKKFVTSWKRDKGDKMMTVTT